MLDSLEARRLLADISIVGTRLQIVGTNQDDQIAIALFGRTQAQVIDSGTVALTFEIGEVDFVSFAGRDGNDLLTVGRVPIRAYLDGGNGNDALSASRTVRNDTLLGGAGNDYLFGAAGNDFLQGGLGDDGLFGGAGDDTIRILSDSSGDDTVAGGDGRDGVDATDYARGVSLIVGDPSPAVLTVDDTILGDVEIVAGTRFADTFAIVSGRPMVAWLGRGNDVFTGGRGNDTVYGGAGRDLISTAGGDDVIFDRDNEIDSLNGGTGNDSATADADDMLNDIESANVAMP